MRVLLTVRHLELDNVTKEYAEEKIVKSVNHYIGTQATTIEIELSDAHGPRSGDTRSCKVNVSFPRIKPLHVEASDPDLRCAIDLCVDKIERVVKRLKTKRKDSARNPKKQYAAKLLHREGLMDDELEDLEAVAMENLYEEGFDEEPE